MKKGEIKRYILAGIITMLIIVVIQVIAHFMGCTDGAERWISIVPLFD